MTFRNFFLSLALIGLTSSFTVNAQPFPSTYSPLPSEPVLIVNATLLTGTGERIENGSLLISDGRIQQVASGNETIRAGDAQVIDAEGRWVTPGLIDVHSHLGVYASPGIKAHSDGNEATAPVTAQVWAEHSIWPQDPGFNRARAGGVTAMQILPGSANLIGGRGVTLKNVPSISYQAMKFPSAPHGLKMACGENPKRVYGERKQTPSTRMGNVAGYRAQWIEAQKYIQDWDEYEAKKDSKKNDKNGSENKTPTRDLRLETLAAVLKGEVLVHMHCYRADEMMTILDMADEFGYTVSAFHHGVEAYKVADELAENNVCGALWADWWGFKAEAYDGIQENIALVDRPEGSCAIVHSDSEEGIQRLNQEAAKAMTRGRRAGMDIQPEHAIRWITANPAKSMGILDQTGTLEAGKMADVVIWNGNPFSVYAKADQVFVDGALLFDRNDPERQPVSDFELGQQLGAAQ
ncbi:MAG: amidohydrolase [Xanthomonadales bacterium]|jgi:imidazolonepropionase-like amidohydrolase|nr:amidohydrolase [Xanthomonadales bacterium]MDH3940276.1 amidohydrolase [Xanthomonadales bacterium]MDH4000442.1 amidohydrolase [Xanthomonadales bacterium]